MTIYDPSLSRFDLDKKRGATAELWVDDIRKALAEESATIEVKRDAWFPKTGRLYIETECRWRDGAWHPSGINTTEADLWFFVFGAHPGGLVVATKWLKCAVVIARKYRNEASCDYGDNPTRGVYVYPNHILQARDLTKDEH